MKIGLNWTSPKYLPVVRSLLGDGAASFCEIMADNFLHIPPDDLAAVFPGVPVAFHIMNSQFILRDQAELAAVSQGLKPLIAALHPLYVSDHLALFSHEGRQLPLILEIDYERQYPLVRERVELWQELIGAPMCFENFPSILDGGCAQPDFLSRLSKETGAGVLFDFSNAVTAQRNCGTPLKDWAQIVGSARHFHAAGYRDSETEPVIVRDSHDGELSQETLEFLASSRALLKEPQASTLVVERDANISPESWAKDMRSARAALS
ncbi:MAG: DUF692 family protein [Elusimicrobia bacterium]|nr:DUF692 family protein [Elusimicrobiota bacterium]